MNKEMWQTMMCLLVNFSFVGCQSKSEVLAYFSPPPFPVAASPSSPSSPISAVTKLIVTQECFSKLFSKFEYLFFALLCGKRK